MGLKFKVVLIFLLLVSFAFPATITVNSINNSGPGTLRDAVFSSTHGDIIRFNPNLISAGNATITLTSPILFTKSLTVIGLYNLTDTLKISGGNSNRIFDVDLSASFHKNLTLDSLVLINGKASFGGGIRFKGDTLFVANSIVSDNNSPFGEGGGIYSINNTSSNAVVISNSNIIRNSATRGAGVYSFSWDYESSVEIINSYITYNSANDDGGGIFCWSNDSLAKVKLIDSEITHNTGKDGGGILSVSRNSISKVEAFNSLISNNTASSGGGIYCYCFSSTLANSASTLVKIVGSHITNNQSIRGAGIFNQSFMTSTSCNTEIINSTINNNNASYQGGGICSISSYISNVKIVNSTINNNSANDNGGGIYSTSPQYKSYVTLNNSTISNNVSIGNGAGIYSSSSTSTTASNAASDVSVVNSTIVNNMAQGYGGGVYSKSISSKIRPTSSIIALNGNGNIINVNNNTSFTINSGGYNLFGDTIIYGANANDQLGVTSAQLMLGTLAYYGGTTKTMEPTSGSFAINNGNPVDTSEAQNRVISGIRDCGAAESCQTESIDTQTACKAFTWIDGNIYTSSNNTATFTLVNAWGCDSIITLNLTITMDLTNSLSGITISSNFNFGLSYQWVDCNNGYSIIAGETNQHFTPLLNGTYACIISDGICIDTSECTTVSSVDIEKNRAIDFASINPSSTSNFITVSFREPANVYFDLVDIKGKTIISPKSICSGERIDLTYLESGVYLARLISNENRLVKYIIKH